jgi:hypothetical protein
VTSQSSDFMSTVMSTTQYGAMQNEVSLTTAMFINEYLDSTLELLNGGNPTVYNDEHNDDLSVEEWTKGLEDILQWDMSRWQDETELRFKDFLFTTQDFEKTVMLYALDSGMVQTEEIARNISCNATLAQFLRVFMNFMLIKPEIRSRKYFLLTPINKNSLLMNGMRYTLRVIIGNALRGQQKIPPNPPPHASEERSVAPPHAPEERSVAPPSPPPHASEERSVAPPSPPPHAQEERSVLRKARKTQEERSVAPPSHAQEERSVAPPSHAQEERSVLRKARKTQEECEPHVIEPADSASSLNRHNAFKDGWRKHENEHNRKRDVSSNRQTNETGEKTMSQLKNKMFRSERTAGESAMGGHRHRKPRDPSTRGISSMARRQKQHLHSNENDHMVAFSESETLEFNFTDEGVIPDFFDQKTFIARNGAKRHSRPH